MRPMLWTAMMTLVAAGGCATYSSFPPVERNARFVSPELEPLPTLMADAILYANAAWGGGQADFAWNLPEGSTTQLYNRVAGKLGAGHPMQRPGEPAYHVRSVRARGVEAEVDILHPAAGGVQELVTLNFDYDLIDGWRVTDRRAWRIPKDAPLPTYAGPAIKAPEAMPVLAAPEPVMAPVEPFATEVRVEEGNMQPLP